MNTTLNIEALQKTQASIADPSRPFHMVNWGTCIYAHANRANGWEGLPHETARRLGVDLLLLFYPARYTGELDDRNLAIAAIQALIDAAQPAPQPEPEPELVCA